MCRVTRVPAIGSQLVLAQTQSMSKNGSRARIFGLFGGRPIMRSVGCGWVLSHSPELWSSGSLAPLATNRFVAAAMDLAMMAAAQGHREFVADLAAERWALREAKVVGVRWLPAADQARLLGNETDVIAVADPPRLREGEHALVNSFGAPLPNRPEKIARARPASDAAASLSARPIGGAVLAH